MPLILLVVALAIPGVVFGVYIKRGAAEAEHRIEKQRMEEKASIEAATQAHLKLEQKKALVTASTYYEIHGTFAGQPIVMTVSRYQLEKGAIVVDAKDIRTSNPFIPQGCKEVTFAQATVLKIQKAL